MKHHHYGTTGARIYLEVTGTSADSRVPMGSLIEEAGEYAEIRADVSPTAPIVRVEIVNGANAIEVIRPESFDGDFDSDRLLITWSGAAFRGRRSPAHVFLIT